MESAVWRGVIYIACIRPFTEARYAKERTSVCEKTRKFRRKGLSNDLNASPPRDGVVDRRAGARVRKETEETLGGALSPLH